MLWGSNPVYGLCLNVGSLLAKMGKHKEATQFLQSVKVRYAQANCAS
jgi:TolA-binding protein